MSIIGEMLEEQHWEDLKEVWLIVAALLDGVAPTECNVCGEKLVPSKNYNTFSFLVCPVEGCSGDKWNAETRRWYTIEDLRRDIVNYLPRVGINPPAVDHRNVKQQTIDWLLTHFTRLDSRVNRELVENVLGEMEKKTEGEK
jgi:hypothetical protein